MLVNKTFFLIHFKYTNDSFVLLSERGSLFHLIDDDELHIFLSYLMQWVIGWCSLMAFLLRQSLVIVLSFILFRKL